MWYKMAQEIKLWKTQSEDQLREIESSTLDLEKRLETWIEDDISIISDGLLIIGRQVPTDFNGRIDLLCIDGYGDLTIIELKRDKTHPYITSQILDYSSWVNSLTEDKIVNIANTYLEKQGKQDESFESVFKLEFDTETMPDELNKSNNMLIVATRIDSSSERIIDYLSSEYDVPINAVTFQCFKDGNDEYIARTFLIESDQKTTTKISKPNSRQVPPKGDFSVEELKDKLMHALDHKTAITPKLICFLKLLLTEDRTFGREEIKKKFQDEKISKSERQSGTHLSNISQFITGPSNSYLQQIVDFENVGWNTKDNFSINSEYRDLVTSVLDELKAKS